MTEAIPEALVVAVMEDTTLGIGLKLPVPVPPVIRNVTPLLNAGLPDASRSVTVTVAWADIVMLSGLIVRFMLAGTGGGGVPTVREALLLTGLAVAVIVTIESSPAGVLAVKVAVAIPQVTPGQAPVVVTRLKLPAAAGATVNVTVAPGMGPAASLTVADTESLPPLLMVGVPRDTRTDVGIRGGTPMVIGALPMIVLAPTVTVARMVALTLTAFAVKVVTAWPDALVIAGVGLKDPEVPLITEKETLTLGITCDKAFVTVAVTVDVPDVGILDKESVTWTVVGPPPPAPVEAVGGFTD